MAMYTGKDDFDNDETIRQELPGDGFFIRRSRSRIVTLSTDGTNKEYYKFNRKDFEEFENMVLSTEFLGRELTIAEVFAFCEKYGYKKEQ